MISLHAEASIILKLILKGHSGSFYLKKNWNHNEKTWHFLRIFLHQFWFSLAKILLDNLSSFFLRRKRNAFWTFPNWTEVGQNRSKWLTVSVEAVASSVLIDNRSKPIWKMLTKTLCIEVSNCTITRKLTSRLTFRTKLLVQ